MSSHFEALAWANNYYQTRQSSFFKKYFVLYFTKMLLHVETPLKLPTTYDFVNCPFFYAISIVRAAWGGGGGRCQTRSLFLFGGLSLFDESATLREAFTKPSRGLREAFAEHVFEKASRSLQGASTNPSRSFTNPSRRLHRPRAPRRRLGGFTRPPRRVRG